MGACTQLATSTQPSIPRMLDFVNATSVFEKNIT